MYLIKRQIPLGNWMNTVGVLKQKEKNNYKILNFFVFHIGSNFFRLQMKIEKKAKNRCKIITPY